MSLEEAVETVIEKPKQKICLNMIVKNEAKDIERCLRSVIPFIDYWVIVDTGSTDDTAKIIHSVMEGIPGVLYSRPWKNFGHNRTEALSLVPEHGYDYIFTIDGDEELILPKDYVRPELTALGYRLHVSYETMLYNRACLLSTKAKWHYEGILHEYPVADTSEIDFMTCVFEALNGPIVQVYSDAEGNTIEKYESHAKLLEVALKLHPEHQRYQFYLGQSYRDSRQHDKAEEAYKKRIEMGGWNEEIIESHFQIAILSMRQAKEEETVLCDFLRAYYEAPHRAGEILGHLTRYLNTRELYTLADLFAKKAADCIQPISVLFIDTQWYHWRAKWEYALTCYHLGRHEEAMQIWQGLQFNSSMSEDYRAKAIEYLQILYNR